MIVGHLMLGVLAGLGAAVASLLAGQPLWTVLLVYVVTGFVVLVGSAAIVALRTTGRPPGVRSAPAVERPLQPVPVKR